MQEVYQQVLVTCTTINVIICLGTLFGLIWIKVSERRERKRKEREKQKLAEQSVKEQ